MGEWENGERERARKGKNTPSFLVSRRAAASVLARSAFLFLFFRGFFYSRVECASVGAARTKQSKETRRCARAFGQGMREGAALVEPHSFSLSLALVQ